MQFPILNSFQRFDFLGVLHSRGLSSKVSPLLGLWFLFRVLAFCFCFAWAAAPRAHAQTAVAPTVGDGLTTATAFQITELGNLVWLGDRAAANDTAGKYYQLMNDIDASVTANWNDAGTPASTLEGFRPIGGLQVYNDSPSTVSFRGVFDGNGQTITGLTIRRVGTDGVGLFGCVGMMGEIRNLTLESGTVSGTSFVGGLTGQNLGSITDCTVGGSVTGKENVGGVVGSNGASGVILDTVSSVVVEGTALSEIKEYVPIGGLVGKNEGGTISHCTATGAVTGLDDRNDTGGLVGYNAEKGVVTDCMASGEVVSLGEGAWSGGLVGYNASESSILNSSATGAVTGTQDVGGLVGGNEGVVMSSFATGDVTGSVTDGYSQAGGLVSGNIGRIAYCYSMGTVKHFGSTGSAGGLLGFNRGQVEKCFASGLVTCQSEIFSGGFVAAGGLVGHSSGELSWFLPASLTDCYAVGDVETFGTSNIAGGLIGLGVETAIKNCYSRGAVLYQSPIKDLYSSNFGDLVGHNLTPGALDSCYWNEETADWLPPVDTDSLEGGEGKTLAELKREATFSGWDFSTVWGIAEGQSTPYLRFAPPPFRLNVTVEGPGSVTLNPAGGVYAPGTKVSLTVNPDAGYHFAGWTGPVADRTTETTTLVMDSDKNLTVRLLRGYEIRTLAELQAVATSGDRTGYYRLMNDLDASDTAHWNDAGTTEGLREGFRPIGSYSDPDTTSFQGVFDGNGKTITGLTLNRPQMDQVGLMGCLGVDGEIWNLTLEGLSVTGSQDVGGLVGGNIGRVTNSLVSGGVNGVHAVGGLAGWNGGILLHSSARGSVTATSTDSLASATGGLVGRNQGGGLIKNCFATTGVTGNGLGLETGGLVGRNVDYARITRCFATGSVVGRGGVGGLAGYNSDYSAIWKCFATGSVSGQREAGGLVGYNIEYSQIQDCFASGPVTGNEVVGGLAGTNRDDATIRNSFATGLVTYGLNTGGLVGSREYNDVISACYWDVETTSQTASAGTGAVGKTTAEMKRLATFQPDGGTGTTDWDFASVWKIAEGKSYPYLRSTPPPFHLILTVDGTGSLALNPSGTQIYTPGGVVSYNGETTVTLTAQPGVGHHFTGWTGPVTDPAHDSTSILVDANKSVTGHFAIDQYPLTVEAEHGSVTKSPDQTAYIYGTTVTLTATPDTGYHFTGWTGGVTDPPSSSTTILMDGPKSVTANFAINEYALAVASEHGSVSKSPDLAMYPHGTTVTLTATPDTGYHFTGWTSGPVTNPEAAVTTVFITGDTSVTAHFEPEAYTLAVVSEHGSVTKSPDQAGYLYGTTVTLTATPDEGYRFLGWTGPVADWTTSSTTLVLTGDTTVTARFGRSYEIRTLAELQAVATGDLEGYYLLMNDIDASVTATWNDAGTDTSVLEGFCPIGTYSSPDTTSFRGVFDGNGKKITGLTINRPKMDYVGLFGVIGKYGRVQNLKMENGRVTVLGRSAGGILAGGNNGRIAHCSASGWISHAGASMGFMTGSTIAGGLVGSNRSSGFLSNCSTSVTVVSPATGSRTTVVPRLGGLVGANSGQLVRCFASGPVSGRLAGGLVGQNSGSVEQCFATGVVTGIRGLTGPSVDESECGGLISNNVGRVTESFATGRVVTNGNGEDSPISGGLIGRSWQNALVQNCFATGAVTGTASSGGGLVGYCMDNTVVQNCFATGTVTGATAGAGGLIGFCVGNSVKVQYCYATGAVTSSASHAGGLIGYGEPIGGVTACYWDVETTSQTSSSGSAPSSGKTTAEMKQQATFQPGGGTGATDWNFTSVWGIFEGETYPFLRAVAPLCHLSVAVEGAGTVAVSPSGTFFAEGTEVTLTARPAAGSRFVRWTGDVPVGAAGQNPLMFTIQKDTSLTVRFEPTGSQPAVWMVR